MTEEGMAYADTDRMVEVFGLDEMLQLTDAEQETLTEPDAVKIRTALDDASALIDGFVRRRYSLPLNPTPALLVRVCCDIARFYLYRDRPTDTVKDAYRQGLDLLKQISAGTYQLSDQTGQEPQSAGEAVLIGAEGRIFNHAKLTGY